MSVAALLLVLASTNPANAQDGAAAAANAQPKKERKICRRNDASESRMGSTRICKTAAEWKAERYDGDDASIDRANSGLSN